MNPQKHSNKKPWAYVSTYSKNNQELFSEIKSFEHFKNNDKTKKYRQNKYHKKPETTQK